jgi:hypothetical protein
VPKEDLAAVINLDQLRPLFPLNILTMHAIDDRRYDVRKVAGMGSRSGAIWSGNQRTFFRHGWRAREFRTGFDPGTDAERRIVVVRFAITERQPAA